MTEAADLVDTFDFAIYDFTLERPVDHCFVGDFEFCALVDNFAAADADRVDDCDDVA